MRIFCFPYKNATLDRASCDVELSLEPSDRDLQSTTKWYTRKNEKSVIFAILDQIQVKIDDFGLSPPSVKSFPQNRKKFGLPIMREYFRGYRGSGFSQLYKVAKKHF